MFEKLKAWLAPAVEYRIVEVERPRPLADLKKMKDGEAAVASLAGHPGYDFLVAKLRIQKAFLDRTLKSTIPTDLPTVSHLINGIYWCGWLEEQVTQAKSKQDKQAAACAASPEELRMFREIQASLTPVGT